MGSPGQEQRPRTANTDGCIVGCGVPARRSSQLPFSLPRAIGVVLGCAVVAYAMVTTGLGCGWQRGKSGGVEQLRQTRLRFRPDERTATCDIVAEIENRGILPIREVQVTATLKSKTGKNRGLNHKILRNISPGEKRLVYMTVRAHGKFHRVELSFQEPKRTR